MWVLVRTFGRAVRCGSVVLWCLVEAFACGLTRLHETRTVSPRANNAIVFLLRQSQLIAILELEEFSYLHEAMNVLSLSALHYIGVRVKFRCLLEPFA